ncbi:MAG: 3-phosphoshikimate 1-carboxyvinyltransferase [Actinomycetota bacterium]|nr:3-phosphoshikimate 1-carboxyvinyltransferase [Actinomycetota bacterium]
MHSADNHDRTWPAPVAAGPVSARVRLPASKSITNRALVLAALSGDPAVIVNPLRARDTLLAAGALRAMGAEITEDQDPESRTAWRITAGSPTAGSRVGVDVGNAGTVMRFLPGVAALTCATVDFDGDARARQRPVGPILAALRQLGADIDDGGRAAVPFSVHGRGSVRGGAVTLDASGSSQLVSGLLLTAPRFAEGITIRHEGPTIPSAPHIAMTVRMLRAAGADATEIPPPGGAEGSGDRPQAWRVRPGRLALGTVTVEPDLSNAGPFLAAALVTAGTITVPDWPRDSLQAAGQILDVLTRMGARCEVSADGLTVTGAGRIHGIEADLRDVSELAPVLTAVAAMADSPSVFTGLAHTRRHETDRLAALAKEINALGGDVTELPDGLQIRPRPLRAGAPFGSYDDHRMVMAAAVLGLAVPGIAVVNAQTVAKTFPGFTDVWTLLVRGGDPPEPPDPGGKPFPPDPLGPLGPPEAPDPGLGSSL